MAFPAFGSRRCRLRRISLFSRDFRCPEPLLSDTSEGPTASGSHAAWKDRSMKRGFEIVVAGLILGLLSPVSAFAQSVELGLTPFRAVTRGLELERRIWFGSLADGVSASNAMTLVVRGVPPRAPLIYRERVNGVVLIASTKTIGTGVLVSVAGDIVTNEHIVRGAHKARGEEWVAVWFKPSSDTHPVRDSFLLA